MIYIFAFVLIISSSFTNSFTLQAQYVNDIIKSHNSLEQIDIALNLPVTFGKDTALLKQTLNPIMEYATAQQNIPLQWVYYMLMADGYSMAFDNTNPKSDLYYKLGNDIVKKHNLVELQVAGLMRQGYYNFVYRKVKEAFPYFLLAHQLKPNINIQKIPLIVQHFFFISSFFNYINDNELAIQYLEESLPYSPKSSRQRINLINSLGLYNEKLNQKDKAKSYFQQALNEAEIAKDSVWIGIISGNLSNYAWQEGDKEEAFNLLKKNIELSIKFDELQDAMRANINLAKYYTLVSEWTLASRHVNMALNLLKNKPYYLQYQMEIAKLQSQIAKESRDKAGELRHLNDYIVLKDSLEQRNDFQKLQNIVWQSEKEKFNRAVLDVEENRIQAKRIFWITIIFSILIFCIIILLVNKSKIKIKIKNQQLEQERLTLSYEKQLVDQEVIILKNSLEDYTQNLKKNEKLISQLRKELVTSEQQSSQQIQSIQDNLNTLLEAHIMTHERWLKFRSVFDKVYPGYLKEMKETHIKLTENDLKILALQKLDLSNYSMSELLCISVEGIKKAKHRLKKKMNMTNSISL